MPYSEDRNNPEFPKKKYAEDIYDTLPEIETGVEIPHVGITRLTSGKDATLKLSVPERISRDGWDFDQVMAARQGETLVHRTGQEFEVVKVEKGKITIKDVETDTEGAILANPLMIRAHEYDYRISDNAGSDKKVKIFDTIYRDRSLDTNEFLDDIVKSIPASCLDLIDEIQIHREQISKAGAFRVEPSLVSGKRIVSLYVSDEGYPTKQAIESLYHELGHAIARHLKGKVNPGERWSRAMRQDDNSVSKYAERKRYPRKNDNGEIEDFADSVMMYLATDGAKVKAVQPLREFCQNRFAKLDEVFEELETRKRVGIAGRIKNRIKRPDTALGN